ncbi:hypothetical protein [Streptomonospora alba]|uniref:hypothetical protein n=1 Tax=Streptomonospora alba TaxID=183763 RepID=UPI0012EE9EE9|nr:hypothetical protein [Streptomonospora alba]
MIESDQLTWNPEEIQGRVLNLLHKATATKTPEYTKEALTWLARLYFVMGNAYPDTKDFQRFKQNTLKEMGSPPNESGIFDFITHCFNRAGSTERDEYILACQMRSVIQIFCDEIEDIELLIREPDRGDVEQIDELLYQPREFKTDIERPAWTPAYHWWWTVHNRTDR